MKPFKTALILSQVFELLRFLPNFDASNWRSTIREEVRVHPGYKDLEPWNGIETADIVYHDIENELGRAHHNSGYQFEGLLDGIRFDIEVKSTTGRCEDTFYMSGSQYQRVSPVLSFVQMYVNAFQMQRREPGSVYVLFRVFNIDKVEIGLKIFVDPEIARQRGELNFTVNTWAVRAV